MQTREDNLNDLIQSLKTSSDYRQQQERLSEQRVIRECTSFTKDNSAAELRTLTH